MKFSNIKFYILKKAMKHLIVLSLVCSVLIIFYIIEGYFLEKKSSIYEANVKVNGDIIKTNVDIFQSNEDYKLWEKIKSNNFAISGIRVKESQKLLDELKSKYLINNFLLNLQNPVARLDFVKQHILVEYSEMQISFDSYADTEVFKFLDALYSQMPGLVQFAKIDMRALSSQIDDDVLEIIKKGGLKDIVKVRALIIWQDIKEKKK